MLVRSMSDAGYDGRRTGRTIDDFPDWADAGSGACTGLDFAFRSAMALFLTASHDVAASPAIVK